MSPEKMGEDNIHRKDVKNGNTAKYGLLYIIRSYNEREISFEEWLKRSREWAEGIIKQYGKAD
jgi:hypothetical protein